MLHLLTTPATARRTVRGVLGTIADAARSVVAPAALVEAKAAATEAPAAEPTEAPDPQGLLSEDEMPDVADIERAALSFDLACDNARQADRTKRKHRKLLDKLPAGTYGQWLVRRVPSNRQTPDLVAIRATYERLGLGDIPMRDAAPSLRVERAELPAVDTTEAPAAEDVPLLASARTPELVS